MNSIKIRFAIQLVLCVFLSTLFSYALVFSSNQFLIQNWVQYHDIVREYGVTEAILSLTMVISFSMVLFAYYSLKGDTKNEQSDGTKTAV